MNRRAYLALAGTTVTALLAGCQGDTRESPGDGSPTTTDKADSDTTTKATPRPTTTPVQFEFPPGFSKDGVVDAREVTEAHWRSLAGRTYTVSFREQLEIPEREYVGHFDLGETRGYVVDSKSGLELYYDGTALYRNEPDSEGPPSVRTLPHTEERRFFLGTIEHAIFPFLGQYRYADPEIRTVDGTPIATYPISGEYTGRLSIEEQGRVSSIHVEKYAILQYDYRVSDVGSTTVERPDWVEPSMTTPSS
ncbi:MAG: hypothetical protein ABEJ58_05775 [Halodesulfurarchaeum sp.]